MRLIKSRIDGSLVYQDIPKQIVGTSNPEFEVPSLDKLLGRAQRYSHPTGRMFGQFNNALHWALQRE